MCASSVQYQCHGAARLQEQGEMQRLRAQLQRAQDSLHAQELELERLRLLQDELGDSRREQQVSCRAAAHASGQVEPDRVKDYARDAPILVSITTLIIAPGYTSIHHFILIFIQIPIFSSVHNKQIFIHHEYAVYQSFC